MFVNEKSALFMLIAFSGSTLTDRIQGEPLSSVTPCFLSIMPDFVNHNHNHPLFVYPIICPIVIYSPVPFLFHSIYVGRPGIEGSDSFGFNPKNGPKKAVPSATII